MRFYILVLFALLSGAILAAPLKLKIGNLMVDQTTTGAGSTYGPGTSGEKTYQATVTGTGAVTATVLIQASNNPTNLGWVTLGTITLSGTTTDTDGFATQAGWGYCRANVTAISGTSASVDVTVAQE